MRDNHQELATMLAEMKAELNKIVLFIGFILICFGVCIIVFIFSCWYAGVNVL